MSIFYKIFSIVFLCFLAVIFNSGWGYSDSLGEQRILIIMTKFPDVQPSISLEKMQEKYFNKLNRYLKAVSYGKTSLIGKTTKWYTLPNDVEKYKLSQHNLKVDNQRVIKLIQDTINLADPDEDFTIYPGEGSILAEEDEA